MGTLFCYKDVVRAVNVFDKQLQRADKWWFSSVGIRHCADSPSLYETEVLYEVLVCFINSVQFNKLLNVLDMVCILYINSSW